jgi:hypothetical protein
MVKHKNKKISKNYSKTRIKHGQISIIIIIAIVLVLIIISFFVYGNYSLNKNGNSANIKPISDYMSSCIKETGKNGIRSTGLTAGYFDINYSTMGGTPYYYDKGKNLVPPIEELENQLNLYMNYLLNRCNLSKFQDFEITKGEIKTTTKIQENKVIFNVEYPLTINKDNKTEYLKDFKNIEVPVRLYTVYFSIKEFFNQSKSSSSGICLSCLESIGNKNDIHFELYDYDNDTVLFVARDNKILIDNEPYQFIFAGKYPQANKLGLNKK